MDNMENNDYKPAIQEVLRRLGIGRNYEGYYSATEAINIAIKEPNTLLHVTKTLYPAVAKRRDTSTFSVERNIRTVAKIAFKRNPNLLCIIARHPVQEVPAAGEFIDMVAQYVEINREKLLQNK